ncbi:uncharacterized protein [Drosophila tropicalis]|uniref:uncharacterized protein n=1 Tax=Drosophila tropicalis TaxID=46794 RepID=UPI0035AB9538
MAGLIGVCLGRSVPALTLPVSAFNWPTNDQSSVVDDLGFAVTQNPGTIEPRQRFNPNTVVTSLDDFAALSGDEITYTAPEDQISARTLHKGQDKGSIVLVYVQNNSNSTQTTATTTAATTRLGDFAGYYRAPPPSYGVPMQYFRTHQDQSQLAWNDLTAFGGLGGFGSGGPGVSGASGVPLVPISLPNNQVAYVPLNLRMLRQLTNKMPIRESDQQSDNDQQNQQNVQDDDQEDDVPLSMLALQSNDDSLVDPKPNLSLNDASAAGSAFNLNVLGQRRKSQPSKMAVRNPFRTFAKNMNLRRVQFV